MVQDNNTNEQYHELVDPENLVYERRDENSIFFEVRSNFDLNLICCSQKNYALT